MQKETIGLPEQLVMFLLFIFLFTQKENGSVFLFFPRGVRWLMGKGEGGRVELHGIILR